jgi:protein SCO1/2
MPLKKNRDKVLALSFLLLLVSGGHARANGARPQALRDVEFDQKLGAQVALDIKFRDETGKAVQVSDYFTTKPVILMLAYYKCPHLCPLASEGLVKSLKAISFDAGKEFNVLTASIDPNDSTEIAAAKKQKYLQMYGRPGAEPGWHFLTGEKESIDRLAQAVGYRYTYDAEQKQYAHSTGILVLTPQGKVSRYFYGIEYAPKDLRLALIEASSNKIGSPVDQLLLFCYQYDPATGKYTLAIMNVLRLAAVATVGGLSAFVLVMFRRERLARAKTE